jgi:hypothetical protein
MQLRWRYLLFSIAAMLCLTVLILHYYLLWNLKNIFCSCVSYLWLILHPVIMLTSFWIHKLHVRVCVYVYIYICVCVCVCVYRVINFMSTIPGHCPLGQADSQSCYLTVCHRGCHFLFVICSHVINSIRAKCMSMIHVLNTVTTRIVVVKSDESFLMCLFQTWQQFAYMWRGVSQQVPF